VLADRRRKTIIRNRFCSQKTITLPRLALLWATLLLVVLGLNPAHAAEQYWEYTVRPGDNIWNLTKQHCTSVRYWLRIQKLNNVDLDREIPPGTRLRFPLSILKHQPASAGVLQVRGQAALRRAGADQDEPVQVGARLLSGDRVTTGADGNLTLAFADGSRLLVLADSDVVMDHLSAWGTTGMVDTRIRLQEGRVDTRVQPARGPGSRYNIITPAAVAAVRGTAFRVAADAAQDVMRSEVTDGTVGVGDDARSTAVPAGYGLVAEAGKPPGKPRELLPPVNLSSLPEVQRRLPLVFTWPPLDGARGYRIQIAPNTEFDALLVDQTTTHATAAWNDLPNGRYAVRVRGIDAVGLEGLDKIRQFDVAARPFAPVSTSPADAGIVHTATPSFSWPTSPHDQAYRIQLARDADFSAPIIDRRLDAGRYRPKPALTPGTYYWRVAALDPQGSQGPYNAAQRFTYRQPLATPILEQAQINRKRLTLTWPAIDGAHGYQLQFATDPAFRDLLMDSTLKNPQLDIPRPASQVYYVRVRALAAGTTSGSFSQPQKLYVGSLYPWWPVLLVIPLLLAL